MTARHVLLTQLVALFHAASIAVAFQFPTKSTSKSCIPSQRRPLLVRTQNFKFTLHSSPKDENCDDSSSGDKLPFLARTIQKILRKPENTKDYRKQQSSLTAEKDAQPISNKKNINDDDESAATKAFQMMALAEKIRLEAELSEMVLALEKIAKLETKAAAVGENPDWRSGILNDVRLISQRLDPPEKTAVFNKSDDSSKGNSRVDVLIPDQEAKVKANRCDDTATQTLLTKEKVEDAVNGFEQLPQPFKNIMAKQVGLADGTNATLVIEKLMAENLLRQAGENETFAFSTTIKADDLGDILIDPQFIEMNTFISSMLPEVTRKQPLNEEYVTAFCKEVLDVNTFSPDGKPENVPGGFIIRGESRVKSQQGRGDGDVLIETIGEKLAGSSVNKSVQCYYILDPTPASGEEILNEEDELPLLLLTNYDVSPNTNVWVKPLVSLLALTSVVGFALGSFSMNVEVLDRATKAAEAGSDLSWLYALSFPIAWSILTTQMAHEVGHLIVALKDDVSAAFFIFVSFTDFSRSLLFYYYV
ncbi:hypothetical protein ACHAWX_003854 [Stephanocyclus meneghinianus]